MAAVAPVNVEKLVEKFNSGFSHYTASLGNYLEADVRSEFIDPLLRELGWDIDNRNALIPSMRPVVREENQPRAGKSGKRPDYTLRVNGINKFYVEAKKPSVDILNDLSSIRQARSYGWTGQHPIAVLTNFRHIRVFDATVPIDVNDLPTTALLFESEYRDLNKNWSRLYELLGQESVEDQSWEAQFKNFKAPSHLPADERFIRQLNQWRLELGDSLVNRNPQLTGDELNDAVQQILNRLIFVRMCEDRGIEGEGVLRDAFAGTTTDIAKFFDKLDRTYNTGIFGPSSNPRDPMRLVDAHVLREIVNHLYAPFSPFSFAVLDADFLGLVYESTLAEYLTVSEKIDHRSVALNPKKEYEKRDVVTTPQVLVDSTVQAAFAELTVHSPTVLDFAVGSGRFLVSAFETIVQNEIARRLGLPGRPGLLKIGDDDYRLVFEEKRRVLEECCFGIDIDFNAVEVARFSLLIRLLEDETAETLPAGKQRILPSLESNIIHGNTLVREMPSTASEENVLQTRPLDLEWGGLPASFDLIVGNPPYMAPEEMKAYNSWELQYLKKNYRTAHKQFDKYFAFVEFAVDHLSKEGVLGVVIPNKWMTIGAATKFRSMLREEVSVVKLSNFRHVQLFEEKSIYVCILVASHNPRPSFEYSEPDSAEEYASSSTRTEILDADNLPTNMEGAWVLPANPVEARVLKRLFKDSIPLGQVVKPRNGVQTSANAIMVLTSPKVDNGYVEFENKGRTWRIEEAITRPYLDDSKGIRSHREVEADSRIIFPYRTALDGKNSSGYEVLPEHEMAEFYPLAFSYLQAHREKLAKRNVVESEREKAFYVYGRTQAIGYCTAAPKIFYSVNQRGEKYGLDTTGIVYQSGGTAGEVALFPEDARYSLDYVLGVLDQPVVEFYLRKRGSPFRGGYFARGTAVIAEVPLPKLNFDDPEDIRFQESVIDLMKGLRKLNSQIDSIAKRDLTGHKYKIATLRKLLQDLFLERWGLSAGEVETLRL
ncbi:Type IIS restriction enzyme Eco57I [Corynebacterium pilosum]|uniref:site-specific DNA-methyltransferase (adenine-specific) n=3 Tax=Corynebacterium pilosum TaxID=35756 RepID=A0A376CLW8_9CORY|nr:Type IIS restriction enzyme Eco57I [Corynebacterium pilosum]